MLVKIHDSYRRVIAICDSDLIGKKFEEGKIQLDIKEPFYSGDEVEDDRVIEILRNESNNYATFSIAGPKAVKLALESGVITEGNIRKVDGVPFALALI